MEWWKEHTEELAGAGVGSTQVLAGHPFDTAKSHLQRNLQLPSKFLHYYRGIGLPFAFNSIVNSIFFGVETRWHRYTNNHFISGMVAGTMGSLVVCPVDNYKFKYQLGNSVPVVAATNASNASVECFSIKDLPYRPFRGLVATISRESFGIGIYFSVYNAFKLYYQPPTDTKAIIYAGLTGGVAGILSWTTFPLDTIKTRVQTTPNLSMLAACRAGDLLHGLNIAMYRAFIINGAGFMTYEYLFRKYFTSQNESNI